MAWKFPDGALDTGAMVLLDQLRFLKSQAIYWRYATITDPEQPLYRRRTLAKLGQSPYRPPHDKQRLILVPVPKVGGNSLIAALYGLEGARELDRTPQHKPALLFKFADPVRFADYFKVAFVRNPWDRLVSAYTFLDAGGKHGVDAQWSDRYISPNGNFASFVKRLAHDQGFGAAVMRSPHFIPQHRFVCDDTGANNMDFLGRYERLAEDFQRLRDQIGSDADLPRENIGDHAPYRDYYNDETTALVREIYARDIALFGYEF